ncbi:multiple epidermal growth factor-like domains protein 10 [Saccostrea cucullata]|uniref:multiple epidermal growth factor-like domains protein 10 n=1 Tax=Saccostrea cuccullata TaxID=36930 RepID=UPI002ED1F1E2
MEHMYLLFVTYFLCSISYTSTSDITICTDSNGTQSCCHDYKNISGKCTACIGSYGKGCSNPCTYGYYGHGCRGRCDCSENQICDKRRGCLVLQNDYLKNITKSDYKRSEGSSHSLQSMIIIICGVLALVSIVLGMVCYLRSKLTENGSNTNTDDTDTSPSGNACSIQQEQGEYIYNDVRESRMIENTRMIRPENVSMQNRSKMMRTCTSVPKPRRENVQESTSSCSFDLGNYGGCSDTYSRLHLINMRTSTLPPKTSVNMNDYALMEKENFKEDEYANQAKKKNPTIARSGVNQSRIYRPYSSVKYHRNVDQE